ncbi:CDP-diacylglycerol--glycerol-3-phosphate 3-phosphatidyltransferase [Acidaminobacter sp. JC074]|uniref:CDP-diacylglycerol--glycerol-3-phosphate 3-phosphatidyltransferase n=1 Tax=Acidaminobacter sp. JC074 TaxID=2530199 RepID=UPI001F0E1963|nr:CDP-diacylglycerol--glycerol-3-phosphate 3-phosphatidyltransferase [Acidaminobacter sp. JC074]MCH4888763.1 CDP-diacylglycerol--glycerol-3-phosphate 3-phosphatidyltransferase [Acidaminobacter sp. JC074]
MKIPNILTSLRIAMIPLFIFLFFSDIESNYTYAFIVFALAGITDILDGYIARRFDMITDAGKVLDPLADKLMLMSVLICLASTNMVPLWLLTVMVIKELIMVYGGIRLYYSKTQIIIPSNKFGKMATVSFYIAICMVLLNVDHLIASIVLYIAVGLALYAFFNYVMIVIRTKSQET